jgi:hypothetical protein
METAKRRGNPNWGQVMPYDEARQLIKSKQFKTLAEYKEWVMIEKPEGLSVNPYQIYRYRGDWVSTAHFLGKEEYTTPMVQEYNLEINSNFFSNLKDTLKSIIQSRLRRHSYMN